MTVEQVYYADLAREVRRLLVTLPTMEFTTMEKFCFKDLVVVKRDYYNVLEKAPQELDVVYDQLKLLKQLLETAKLWKEKAIGLELEGNRYAKMGLKQIADEYYEMANHAWSVYNSLIKEVVCDG